MKFDASELINWLKTASQTEINERIDLFREAKNSNNISVEARFVADHGLSLCLQAQRLAA